MKNPRRMLLGTLLIWPAFLGIGRADRLEEVPLELRAALAVMACANPHAPEWDPLQPGFRPEAAPDRLETYIPGEGGMYQVELQQEDWNFTLLVNLDQDDEAFQQQALTEWRETLHAQLMDWPEVAAPVYLSNYPRKITLASETNALIEVEVEVDYMPTARAQVGPWIFEVVAEISKGMTTGNYCTLAEWRRREAQAKETIRSYFRKLWENAQHYRLFPHRLVVEYFPGPGQAAILLAPDQPFRISLDGMQETRVVFRLYMLDPQDRPVKDVDYRVRLMGPLARFAQVDRNGVLAPQTEQVFEDVNDPVLVKWIFPAVSETAFAEALGNLAEAETDLSLGVEAKFIPTSALPPPA